jgi:hypothetical protein
MSSNGDDEDVLISNQLRQAAQYMGMAHFSRAEISEAIAYMRRFGTVQGCAVIIQPKDRNAIEAMLPADPLWKSIVWDHDRFELGPGACDEIDQAKPDSLEEGLRRDRPGNADLRRPSPDDPGT